MVGPARVDNAAGDDVADFYVVTYTRLVGVLARVCDGREDAEEVVQEAFVRLVQWWPKVSRYDDPEAWVRSVAFRLATSRWRKRRAGAAALLRLGPARHVTPPSVDRVTVDAVLAPLSPDAPGRAGPALRRRAHGGGDRKRARHRSWNGQEPIEPGTRPVAVAVAGGGCGEDDDA